MNLLLHNSGRISVLHRYHIIRFDDMCVVRYSLHLLFCLGSLCSYQIFVKMSKWTHISLLCTQNTDTTQTLHETHRMRNPSTPLPNAQHTLRTYMASLKGTTRILCCLQSSNAFIYAPLFLLTLVAVRHR